MIVPSERAIAAMTAENSGEAWADLITLTHADLESPIRLSNDKTEILSMDGDRPLYGTRSTGAGRFGPDKNDPVHTFDWVPFSLTWPGYEEGTIPEIRLAIDMIDRSKILPLLRTYRDGRVKCFAESVLAAEPDRVNFRFVGFYLVSAPWDDVQAQLVLQLARYDLEPYPAGRLTPVIAPGLHP